MNRKVLNAVNLLLLLIVTSNGFHILTISGETKKRVGTSSSFWHSPRLSFELRVSTVDTVESDGVSWKDEKRASIVLIAGFESFNTQLYGSVKNDDVNLSVFADKDIRGSRSDEVERSISEADCIIMSLIFDYDDALKVTDLLQKYDNVKCRLIFESATEIMKLNQLGSFSMMTADGLSETSSPYTMEEIDRGMIDQQDQSGPPPAVRAILSKFSSGKEEDKLQGYLQLLKVGPDLLKYFPGEKVADLKSWLEAYRFWNQGGINNFSSMISLLHQRYLSSNKASRKSFELPALEITPDIGLFHPLNEKNFFLSPKQYLEWRLSEDFHYFSQKRKYKYAPSTAPRIAVLLYRKHVITSQPYIPSMINILESQGFIPIPIFINGVEAHTIVRDLLTSTHEIDGVRSGDFIYDDSYQPEKSVTVDAIVSTIGFPLVGGPAGSMQAGRNIEVAVDLLKRMDVPYICAAPLLLQDIKSWRSQGVQGLQSVVLYSLPELDGAVDSVVLGGLVGDKISIIPERVRKLCSRLRGWIELRRTPKSDRRIAISIYGFPPNVGATGTAALLDVPRSLDHLLRRLHKEGYDVGDYVNNQNSNGESLVAALAIMSQDTVITRGAGQIQDILNDKINRAQSGDLTIARSLAKPLGGLGGAEVRAYDVNNDQLENSLGRYMFKKVDKSWGKERGPSISAQGNSVVSGLQIGNVWITVQPLLGLEGDPMRMLFERDLTPHHQYCAAYEWMKKNVEEGGIGAQAVIHLGMHGTVEWLPGLPLGNDRSSWPDSLLGSLPNIYVYAANNPSESILAKRRGYGTIVSYNVPPYGRAGLYLELSALSDLVGEYRSANSEEKSTDLRETIWSLAGKAGITSDVPLVGDEGETSDFESVSVETFDVWTRDVGDYLILLQERLFSSGLHTLGEKPSRKDIKAYLEAYFGDKISSRDLSKVLDLTVEAKEQDFNLFTWLEEIFGGDRDQVFEEAKAISSLLLETDKELDGVIELLDGGYIAPAPGGDLLRDGPSVLPTGRNIHALDPYRMPSLSAWARGKRAVDEIIRQHMEKNNGEYPETVAVTLWGLDAIKTRGESVAIALALIGAEPIKEGTGRIVRFDLQPLPELGRPRIDVLASMSGIFRDSFANIVDLLDDVFERAAFADEPIELNYIKKHAEELKADGVERPAARLFSNPPGDYGSMVNEVVGSGEWEDEESLGEVWRGRNQFSYGRGEGENSAGKARPEVLDKLLASTERIVQEIDSVEYGLTDIQEYYANTGALKKAAENRKTSKKKVSVSIIEAFSNEDNVPVQELESVLRVEYRSKLLNPKWRDAMISQGSGGAYEVSQRMTAMLGWAATSDVDNFVFDQAAERYALDESVAQQLQNANPEAFKNIIRRLLEAEGRGLWETSDDILERLRELYSDADDKVEQVNI